MLLWTFVPYLPSFLELELIIFFKVLFVDCILMVEFVAMVELI